MIRRKTSIHLYDHAKAGYKLKMETKGLALMALLASVYALGSLLPGFPMIGVSGSTINVVRSLEMGYGLILGPVLGPLTAFLGAIVGRTLMGGGFAMFFTPLAPLSAFVAASLASERIWKIRGWVVASVIMLALIVFWYLTPPGIASPLYPIPHLMGLGIILVFRGRLADYLRSSGKEKLAFGVALCSYPSTMAGHMLGNLIFIYLLRPDPLFFVGILPIAIVERLVFTLLSTLIATPLILAVRILFPGLMRRP